MLSMEYGGGFTEYFFFLQNIMLGANDRFY